MKKKEVVLMNYDRDLTSNEIADRSGASPGYVREVLRAHYLQARRPPSHRKGSGRHKEEKIRKLSDGILTSQQIAKRLGYSKKYVQKIMLKLDLPRRRRGSAIGELNGSWKGGRIVDLDGYALVTPSYQKFSKSYYFGGERRDGRILEHRLIVAQILGRPLTDQEIVDHIDGLRLHNSPSNLRLFSNNAEHLKTTTTGKRHFVSDAGMEVLRYPRKSQKYLQPVDRYHRMKVSGDARLIQILLLSLKLGTSSPYLLGTNRHLKKTGISDFSHSNLKRELNALYQKWELNPCQ